MVCSPFLHLCHFVFFFFSSRRRHTRLQGDWSSDVCSSDLARCWRWATSSVSSPQGGNCRMGEWAPAVGVIGLALVIGATLVLTGPVGRAVAEWIRGWSKTDEQ